MHWWAVFCIGIVDSEAFGYYSISCFVFTVIFLAGILISGSKANKIKREDEFWVEKIAERKAELADKKKMDDRKKKEEAIAAADELMRAEIKAAAAAEAAPEAGFTANIQDAPAPPQAAAEPAGDNRLIKDDRA